jgi:hypothetical protein
MSGLDGADRRFCVHVSEEDRDWTVEACVASAFGNTRSRGGATTRRREYHVVQEVQWR